MATLLKYQKLTLLWALFVLVICSIPLGGVESSTPMFFPGFDKLVHCGLFFVFTTLITAGSLRQAGGRLKLLHILLPVLAGIIFGGVVELLQLTLFTWRKGDWADLFADSVGAGMAGFCTILILTGVSYEKS